MVEVHLDNLVLRVISFKLHCNHPLNWLLEQSFHNTRRLRRIKLLGKLLRDGAATARILLHEDSSLDNGTSKRLQVDSRVRLKAGVLSGNQSILQVRRKLIKIHIHTVALAVVVASQLLSVG